VRECKDFKSKTFAKKKTNTNSQKYRGRIKEEPSEITRNQKRTASHSLQAKLEGCSPHLSQKKCFLENFEFFRNEIKTI